MRRKVIQLTFNSCPNCHKGFPISNNKSVQQFKLGKFSYLKEIVLQCPICNGIWSIEEWPVRMKDLT